MDEAKKIEQQVFRKTVVIPEKLISYGFRLGDDSIYRYSETFLDGSFRADIQVTGLGEVSGTVFDCEDGSEYLPIRVSHHYGSFVGTVREAYQDILIRIREACFQPEPFLSPQANRLTRQIAARYAELPDFPFTDDQDTGVFRLPANRKWYGIIIQVKRSKLRKADPVAPQEQNSSRESGVQQKSGASQESGVQQESGASRKSDATQDPVVEIINVRVAAEERDRVLANPSVFPAYHMHHQKWISILLDGSIADEEVLALIDKSRDMVLGQSSKSSIQRLAGSPVKWVIPANPKFYDVEAGFRAQQELTWKQSSKVWPGDIVYMYVGAPVSAIRFRCVVTAVDIPYSYQDENLTITRVMKIRLERTYDPALFPISRLRKLDLAYIRGPRTAPAAFLKEIEPLG
ncbi:MAG: MmcQ/YjbR family DNA-binding protein [Firmicutes bacterium]|nr:MmcQ/YjbR family DNA-binding protein [Bacillota bacterium]